VNVISASFHHVVKPAHLKLRQWASGAVDRRLGIETIDESVARTLGIDLEDFRNRQRSLGWSGTWRMLRYLAPTVNDTFFDVGCGVGRVLCGAAQFGFRRVIGIDIDPTMTGLAERNARLLRGRRCPIDIVTGDATTFTVPDDVTIVFLYNPVQGETLLAVMRRLIESADRSPRAVRVVYANPQEHHLLMTLGRFKPSARISLGWRPGQEWRLTQAVQFYDLYQLPISKSQLPRDSESTG
jgi:SAM-dependent methyltransferase